MEDFVSVSLSLLSLERAEEVAQSEGLLSAHLQSPKSLAGRGLRGTCLQRLAVNSQRVGLYGRQVVTLEAAGRASKKATSRPLPSNSITSGDIVGLFVAGKPPGEKSLSGVVTQSKETSISVAFDELPDTVDLVSHNGSIQLVKLANDVTYRRIKRALEGLLSYHTGRSLHLVETLFSHSALAPADPKYTALLESEGDLHKFPFHTPGLDSSQHRAVVSALAHSDVAVIHGPPGTGKTTTVVEVILQSVDLGMKVLACAPSNIAVDNMVEKLGQAKARIVRIGHPARLVPSVLQYSLDALVARSDSAQIIQDVRQDIEKAFTQSLQVRTSSEKRKWRHEMKAFRKELKQREEKCLKEILTRADVVLATLTGASPDGVVRLLPEDHFDVVVIDECAQALEASCWISLLRAPKCVLAGDHCQLPPTILSQEAAQKGLAVTLMERLVKEHGEVITSTLSMQYRMHNAIMAWPSKRLYGDILTSHESVATHLLRDMPGVGDTRETSVPLVFIDTAGCGLHELNTSEEESKGNEGEADLVIHHIRSLLKAGTMPKDVAVIAPYNLQVDLIRQRLQTLTLLSSSSPHLLEVHTVDGFQGREKEAVVMSLTRSNDAGEIGFLREQRRTNVAVTRARRHLCLIGDSDTVSHEPFIKGLIEHCHAVGEVWSAHEYLQDPEFEESHYYQSKDVPNRDTVKDKGRKTQNDKHEEEQKGVSRVPLSKEKSKKVKPAVSSCSSAQDIKCNQQFSDATSVRDVNEETQSHLQGQVERFIESSDSMLSFPPSLTGSERRIIHQLCEQYGLLHISRGQGKERFIQVQKRAQDESQPTPQPAPQPAPQPTPQPAPQPAPQPTPCVAQEQPTHDDHCEEHMRQKNTEGQMCDICGRNIPLLNWELHHIQCEKQRRRQELSGNGNRTASSGTSSKTVKNRKPKQKLSTKTTQKDTSEDDLDALLAEVKLADSTCNFPKCRKTVNLIGVCCQFCRQRYCLSHSLAEVHGCGEAAKQHAVKQLHQEARKGHKHSQSAVHRSQLQSKLDKKIEEKSQSRSSKKGGPK